LHQLEPQEKQKNAPARLQIGFIVRVPNGGILYHSERLTNSDAAVTKGWKNPAGSDLIAAFCWHGLVC
jgi:hypothetical protein